MIIKKQKYVSVIFLSLFVFSAQSCSLVNEKKENTELNRALFSLKYSNGNQSNKELYSNQIYYNQISMIDKMYVSVPQIRATAIYEGRSYDLINYNSINTNNGSSRKNYVATFVYKGKFPLVTSHGYINNGTLTNIFQSYELTNTFSISSSIEAGIGVEAGALGFEASVEVKKYMSASVGIGSGYSFELKYDFYPSSLVLNERYAIKKTVSSYEFLTIVYLPDESNLNGGSMAGGILYNYHACAYLSNSISITDYDIVVG
ncbi:MAG: hypothetical protein RR734_01590 [Bacilli bacterium]